MLCFQASTFLAWSSPHPPLPLVPDSGHVRYWGLTQMQKLQNKQNMQLSARYLEYLGKTMEHLCPNLKIESKTQYHLVWHDIDIGTKINVDIDIDCLEVSGGYWAFGPLWYWYCNSYCYYHQYWHWHWKLWLAWVVGCLNIDIIIDNQYSLSNIIDHQYGYWNWH